MYFIVGKADGHIKEKNRNKYLVFDSRDKSKDVVEKYTELLDAMKNLTNKIDNKQNEYGKDYMKVKFSSDGNLPLNRALNHHNLTVVVRFDIILSSRNFRWMFVWVISMLQYKRIDVSEGSNSDKSRKSKECMICHYWCFKYIS